MNDIDFKSSAPGDVATQIAVLQRQVFVLLLVLVVVSMTLASYLAYQDRIARKDVLNVRPQAQQMMNAFNAAAAGINRQVVPTFFNQLVAYGGTHPEYAQQVLKKYGITASTAPAPAPVKK